LLEVTGQLKRLSEKKKRMGPLAKNQLGGAITKRKSNVHFKVPIKGERGRTGPENDCPHLPKLNKKR